VRKTFQEQWSKRKLDDSWMPGEVWRKNFNAQPAYATLNECSWICFVEAKIQYWQAA